MVTMSLTDIQRNDLATTTQRPIKARHRLFEDAVDQGRSAEFLDMPFDLATSAEVTTLIDERDPDEDFAYVVTPNVDHLVRLQRTRSDLWPQYRSAWLRLCDSRVLGHLAHFSGMDLSIVPGSDLTEMLMTKIIRPTDRIAILGGDDAMVAQLSARYGLSDVVHFNPSFGFIKDHVEVARAVDFIVDAHARFTFIAVGSPQQEIVAYMTHRTGQATGIGLCVGASLEFLTGGQKRAPAFAQRLSLEWLFRMASNPRRLWRRYLQDGPTIFAILHHWRRRLVRAGDVLAIEPVADHAGARLSP